MASDSNTEPTSTNLKVLPAKKVPWWSLNTMPTEKVEAPLKTDASILILRVPSVGLCHLVPLLTWLSTVEGTLVWLPLTLTQSVCILIQVFIAKLGLITFSFHTRRFCQCKIPYNTIQILCSSSEVVVNIFSKSKLGAYTISCQEILTWTCSQKAAAKPQSKNKWDMFNISHT